MVIVSYDRCESIGLKLFCQPCQLFTLQCRNLFSMENIDRHTTDTSDLAIECWFKIIQLLIYTWTSL